MISIDFWDTLVQANTGGEARNKVRRRALQKVASDHGKTLTPELINAAKKYAYQQFNNIWLNQQWTPSTEDLVSYILDYLQLPASNREQTFLTTKFEESLWEGPPQLAEGVDKVIPKLASRYSLALISDTMYSPGRIIQKYLEKIGLDRYFASYIFSDETGFSKPNPKSFRRALAQTKSEAVESWHIGDLIETDITGAQNVGMRSILFTGASDSYKENNSIAAKPDHICSNWVEIEKLLL